MFDWREVLIKAQFEKARKLLRVNRMKTMKLPFKIYSHSQIHIQMLVISNTTKISVTFIFMLNFHGESNPVAGNIAAMDESVKNVWHESNNKVQSVA
jgi:hypothetical protein